MTKQEEIRERKCQAKRESNIFLLGLFCGSLLWLLILYFMGVFG